MKRLLPEKIYFNPLSITDKEPTHGREGSYQIYARTHSLHGDAEYELVRVLPSKPREWWVKPNSNSASAGVLHNKNDDCEEMGCIKVIEVL